MDDGKRHLDESEAIRRDSGLSYPNLKAHSLAKQSLDFTS